MLLHRLHLNLRSKEARRDLADPYQMHATLCRAFSPPDQKCLPGEYLWRLEPETDSSGNPRVLVQSRSKPDWSRIGLRDWLAEEPMPGIELSERLGLNALRPRAKFRYRLRANTSKTDILTGKRLGLFKTAEQTDWLSRQGVIRGFSVLSAHLSQSGLLEGKRNAGGGIKVYAVLFDGVLETTDPAKFKQAVADGIGHAKAMGLGLLSVIPLKE